MRDLIEFADAGVGLPIALLINGMIVMGALAQSEVIAEHLDQNRRRITDGLKRPDGISADDWKKKLEALGTQSMRGVQTHRDEEAALETKIEDFESKTDETEQLPEDLERGLINQEHWPNLTLKDVQINAPGQVGITRVPVMRVNVGLIAAWWAPQIDENGNARLTLFESDPPSNP